MAKLSDLIPINLDTEKAKFFAANFDYNPQFVYQKNILKTELEKYGKPKWWYLFLAKRILNQYLKNQVITENTNNREEYLKQDIIEKKIKQRLDDYGLTNKYEVVFSKNFISRISVNNNKKIIKVRLPIKIHLIEIEATLNHEIDTHILRQLNYEQQPWFKKKKKYGFKPYLRTEEGLAIINELIASKKQLAYKSAINYLAVNLALKSDFKTVFKFFYNINHNPERAWTWTLKKKRGLTDTKQKGAFTKDLVYFEGLIEVLNYLKKNQYDVSKLYYGKISVKDIKKAEKIGINKQLILPKFLTENTQEYINALKELRSHNLF